MEYVIHLLALFIALNFLLKVGFYPRWGMWTVAAGCAFFAWLVTPWMTEQSKTVVASFFASRHAFSMEYPARIAPAADSSASLN